MNLRRARRLGFYAAIVVLWAAALVALAGHTFDVAIDAFTHANYARCLESVTLCLMFGFALSSVGLNTAATIAVELRGNRPRNPPTNVRDFYRREATEPLLVMVPSYREEENTIWQTLMSAALAEHPLRDVVLLIDDPEASPGTDHAILLANARGLPLSLQRLFDEASAPFEAAYEAYRRRTTIVPLSEDRAALSRLYRCAAAWREHQAEVFVARAGRHLNHTDALFVDEILMNPARGLRAHADAMEAADLDEEAVAWEYFRLATLFRVRFSSFERKQFANLSHAPNKAMNLNVFMSLIGKSFRIVETEAGRELVAADADVGDLSISAYPFLVAVDADSLITHDYNLSLLTIMRADGNERVAIAQSPYTAVPNAPEAVEYAAAASTDGQYFCHQGLAAFGATSWVGAGALIRRAAMEDILSEREERGRRVPVYIKDDILIEDAAATIDLLRRGWRVHHTDRRLTYSATPSDFGSLIIQRRRWANGGLLLLPRLARVAFQQPFSPARLANAVARVPNLSSAATNGLFFCVMMGIPFDDAMLPAWMAFMLLPSLLLTWHDLIRAGYRFGDIVPVQALSVLLVPVNLAGTYESLRQAMGRPPVPFARTPKIAGRTPTPLAYLMASYGLMFGATITGLFDMAFHLFSHAAFAAVNVLIFGYCIIRFIGLRNSWIDVRMGLLRSRSRFGLTAEVR